MSFNEDLRESMLRNPKQVITCEATVTTLPNGEKFISLVDPTNNVKMMWVFDGTKWRQAKANEVSGWQSYIDGKK